MATLAGFQHPSFFETWLPAAIQATTLHCALIDATIAPETDDIAAIVANEAANANGYSRKVVSTASLTSTYDVTNNRAQFSNLSCSYTPSGGDIVFRSAILIIGGSATYGNTTGSIIACTQWPSSQTLVDGDPAYLITFKLQWGISVYDTVGTNPAF